MADLIPPGPRLNDSPVFQICRESGTKLGLSQPLRPSSFITPICPVLSHFNSLHVASVSSEASCILDALFGNLANPDSLQKQFKLTISSFSHWACIEGYHTFSVQDIPHISDSCIFHDSLFKELPREGRRSSHGPYGSYESWVLSHLRRKCFLPVVGRMILQNSSTSYQPPSLLHCHDQSLASSATNEFGWIQLVPCACDSIFIQTRQSGLRFINQVQYGFSGL